MLIHEHIKELQSTLNTAKELIETFKNDFKHEIVEDIKLTSKALNERINADNQKILEELLSQAKEQIKHQESALQDKITQATQEALQHSQEALKQENTKELQEFLQTHKEQIAQSLAQDFLQHPQFIFNNADFKAQMIQAIDEFAQEALPKLPLNEYIEYEKLPLEYEKLISMLKNQSQEEITQSAKEATKEYLDTSAQKAIEDAVLDKSQEIYYNILSTHTFLTQLYQAKLRLLSGDIFNTQHHFSEILRTKSHHFKAKSKEQVRIHKEQQHILVSK